MLGSASRVGAQIAWALVVIPRTELVLFARRIALRLAFASAVVLSAAGRDALGGADRISSMYLLAPATALKSIETIVCLRLPLLSLIAASPMVAYPIWMLDATRTSVGPEVAPFDGACVGVSAVVGAPVGE